VTRVQITDPENKKLEVIVEDSQLSLPSAEGQNVRLAATDWLGHRQQERGREAPGNRKSNDCVDRSDDAFDVTCGVAKDHREN